MWYIYMIYIYIHDIYIYDIIWLYIYIYYIYMCTVIYSIYCCVGIFIMIIFIISFIISTLLPATRVKREKFQPPKSTILSKPWWVKTPNTQHMGVMCASKAHQNSQQNWVFNLQMCWHLGWTNSPGSFPNRSAVDVTSLASPSKEIRMLTPKNLFHQ